MTILSDILRYCADHNIDIDIPKVFFLFPGSYLDELLLASFKKFASIFFSLFLKNFLFPGSFTLTATADVDGADCRSGFD